MYQKEIQDLLEKENGTYLEKNQALLKIYFEEDMESRSDEQIEPHCYNYFFLHSGVARFIEMHCKENQIGDKSSLEFCKQLKIKRQQFIYQLKLEEELHSEQQCIFLVDQSVESFKLIHGSKNIMPQYQEQVVYENLKKMRGFKQAIKIVATELALKNAKEIKTGFSQCLIIGDRFLKKPLLDKLNAEKKLQATMDLEGLNSITTNDLFVIYQGSEELVDYCCLRNQYHVLKGSNRFPNDRMGSLRFQSLKQLELQAIMLLHYLRELDKMGIYHGDIKPHNIFFDSYRRGFITTDSGTLITTVGDSKEFYRSCWTDGYASKKFLERIKARKPLTLEELKEEDIYQFSLTLKQAYRDRDQTLRESVILNQILGLCETYKTNIQPISNQISNDPIIALDLINFLRMTDNYPWYTVTFWGFFANCLDHSFASLQIPHAKKIENLPQDSKYLQHFQKINYYYIMDEIASIAMETYGSKDISNTRDKLEAYLITHKMPHLWYSIVMRLMDEIHDLHIFHKGDQQTGALKDSIEVKFIESLDKYNQLSDQDQKKLECDAIVDCMLHLLSNFQVAIFGFPSHKHPAFLLFEKLLEKTIARFVIDENKKAEATACILESAKFFKVSHIFQ
ncbi:hypothetical protein FGO68_gene7410 [Halteria grandinella]|uniref:Protein kinase domain-containing protein n=1 Tax=Halteria grandinella TaxID=5974 RepID=A0A8J8NZV2_HALGN|nr:hypothetical protein FGO68_gene7410 [Halteria grandinella]